MHYFTLSYIQPMTIASLSYLHQLTSLTLIIITELLIMKETKTIPDHHIQTQVLNIHVESDPHMTIHKSSTQTSYDGYILGWSSDIQ
jgi:hypothetical protein